GRSSSILRWPCTPRQSKASLDDVKQTGNAEDEQEHHGVEDGWFAAATRGDLPNHQFVSEIPERRDEHTYAEQASAELRCRAAQNRGCRDEQTENAERVGEPGPVGLGRRAMKKHDQPHQGCDDGEQDSDATAHMICITSSAAAPRHLSAAA